MAAAAQAEGGDCPHRYGSTWLLGPGLKGTWKVYTTPGAALSCWCSAVLASCPECGALLSLCGNLLTERVTVRSM